MPWSYELVSSIVIPLHTENDDVPAKAENRRREEENGDNR